MANKLVCVLGAGASSEAKLPTGNELKASLANLLDLKWEDGITQSSGSYSIPKALRKHVASLPLDQRPFHIDDINSYIHEAWHIRDALPQATSIDSFIDTQRGNEKIALCGKLAIVEAILAAERKSLLWFKRESQYSTIDFQSIEETWYSSFFKLLTQGCPLVDLKKRFQELTLIIFNYDRCVEHFLFHAIKNFYRIEERDVAKLIGEITILHPYGSVGALPWEGKKIAIAFGDSASPEGLLTLSNGIRTFTEGVSPESSEINLIKKEIAEARKLAFLGFAFHDLNMKLLRPDALNSKADCFATARDISLSDQKFIKNEILKKHFLFGDVTISDETCYDFFREYRRSLSF